MIIAAFMSSGMVLVGTIDGDVFPEALTPVWATKVRVLSSIPNESGAPQVSLNPINIWESDAPMLLNLLGAASICEIQDSHSFAAYYTQSTTPPPPRPTPVAGVPPELRVVTAAND